MKVNKHESGQVIFIVVFSFIGLVGMVGLAIDGGRLFAERRKVQNVVDNAALAGALALCNNESALTAVTNVTTNNGFDNDGVTNNVTVNNPYISDDSYVEVILDSTIPKTIIQLVFSGQLTAKARAVGYCDNDSIPEGYPPIPFAAFGGSISCTTPALDVSGSSNQIAIDGVIHSNDDWKLSGSENTFGEVTYAGLNEETEGDNVIGTGPSDNNTRYDWPLTFFNIDDWKPGGLYSSDPNYHSAASFIWSTEDEVIPDGIYYATNEIVVSGLNISGNVTFILDNPNGKVTISSEGVTLTPYINGLLIYSTGSSCTNDAVAISGNFATYSGIIYSPNGMIQLSGNESVTVNGCLWGAAVKFNGNDTFVGNCGDFIPPSPSMINLLE